LTYYAEHLAEAGQNEALYALIDRLWMQARYAQTESHSAFAADVALAIATARAEEPANLTQELRACLIYATLNTLFNNLPPEVPGALAWTGKAGRARGLASLVNIEPRRQMQVLWLDPHTLSVKGVFSAGSESQRIMAYRLVAEALLAQGQIDQARQVLLGALAEAETLEIELYAEEDSQASSWAQRTSLSALAPALFRAGEAQRVLATAAQYDPDGADLLLEIAWSLASAGEAAGALQVAHCARGVIDGTDDPATQAAGLASLAWVSARVGELPAALEATDQALRLVEAVEDAFARINMSCTLAAVLSLAGEAGRAAQVVVRALEWIGAGKDLTEIVELLAYQARSLSQAGSGQAIVAQVDRLLPEVRALPDDADREVACVRLVQALAHAGAFERAIELSCSIQNQTSRLAARYFVVTALAEAGQLEWAMALTDEPDSLPWREEMVMVVAPALVYAGRYEQALEVAESVETASVKAALLAGVAQGLARAGEQASAARLADRALAAAETIADQTDHAECLDQIIVALVQVGRCSQTLDEIYSVDSPQEKAVLLGAAARAIGELGDIQQAARLAEQALATLAAPGGSAAIPILMSKMTLLLAQAGEQEAVMRGTEQTLAMTRAFIAELRGLMAGVERVIPPVVEALAQALIQVGAPESLFDLADAFGDPALRTLAQSTAAQALALASLADEANRLAGMIEDETSRLDASQAVAQSLAQVGCIDQALVAAQALPVAFSRAAALGAIAQCMLGQEVEPSRVVGVCRQALAALEEARAEDASGEAWALWILAVALGQAGEPAMAGEAAERILALAQAQADAAQKCNALGFAAQALARSDRAEQALEVARQMLATAREIEDEEKLAGVVNTLTLTLAFVQAGREELDALLNLIVSNTEEDGSRDDALESLAQVLTQVGTSNWALQVTGMLSDDDTRAELLVNIARSLDAQQVEIIDQVVEAAQAIETLASRLRALGELAQYLFQNGFAERALLLWQEAFDGVETDSREALFELLGKGAPILAALDQGQTLEDILRAVLEVETWWK
jgi:tetratricopeptide (TPR) repeat protein